MRTIIAALLTLILAAVAGAFATAMGATPNARTAKDRAALLAGIEVLVRAGVPGDLVVFGDDAFAVVTGGKRPVPVVAAARIGRGRVVAMAHSGYLDAAALSKDGDSRGRLLRNAIAWASGGGNAPSIGILGKNPALVKALASAGYQAWDQADPGDGRSATILIWKNGHDRDGLARAMVGFVRQGGGLISAACPWGWAQVRSRTNPGTTIRDDLPENAALRRFGMAYADGTVDATAPGGYSIELSRPNIAHAGRAFKAVLAGEKGATRQAYLVERALRALPASDGGFRSMIRASLDRVPPGLLIPREKAPLTRKQALARLAVTERSLRWRDLPPKEVEAAPGADLFPGAVPKRARRVTRIVEGNPAVSGWQGTGLYLAPGEVLTVRATGRADPRGWRLRIGCHRDKLWHKDEWKRWPEITHTIDLRSETTAVATPFGGPIYLEAVKNPRAVTFKFSGAVEAPRYVLGDKASARAWKKRRTAPGPFAELEGRNLVLTVPSAVIRELDDPAPILEFWDAVLKSHCDLAQTPLPARRERFVPDVQISAGYMHAGYPIMTWMDVVTPKRGRPLPPILDIEDRKKNGAWGYFHELGHNRQRSWWTFRGTVEVTCNLFSLFTHETLCGITPWEHPWLVKQKKSAKPYLAKGAPFAEWRRKPGLALITYAQIQHEFGWKPFQQVFKDMEALSAARRPTRDQDKIDEFIRRMSRATGHDLRPFWRMWGAPLGPALMKDAGLDALPKWMPDGDELP